MPFVASQHFVNIKRIEQVCYKSRCSLLSAVFICRWKKCVSFSDGLTLTIGNMLQPKPIFTYPSARNQGTWFHKMYPLSRPLTCMALRERTQAVLSQDGTCSGDGGECWPEARLFSSWFSFDFWNDVKILILTRRRDAWKECLIWKENILSVLNVWNKYLKLFRVALTAPQPHSQNIHPG